MTFLCDGEEVYTYDDLLKSLNNERVYYPYYKAPDLYSYFVNLIKGLVSSCPLILIDSDINPSEVNGLDERLINVPQRCENVFTCIEEVLDAVRKSSSTITIFTSGTTGQPKKVTHTMSTLTRSVRIGDKYKGQIWAFAYNPTHMAGLQVFFQAFENQNTMINVFNQPREYVLHEIKEKGITHISATPTFYRLLLPIECTYNNVVRVTLGGEKSDDNLYESIKQIFPNSKINNVYASTEAGSLFAAKGDCFQIPKQIRNKFLVEDDELLIHRSLLGHSDGFDFSDDYYHSGDLIEWVNENEGIFRFKSRKNELINVGGYKVNPGEVEMRILSITGVHQALVYGKANSILGNILCADIVLEAGVDLTELEIKKILSAQLQDFKVPRRIKFVREISLTRTGKIKRQ